MTRPQTGVAPTSRSRRGHTTHEETNVPSPRICDRCGRTTSDYTVVDNENDRGPADLALCTDADACNEAKRDAQPTFPLTAWRT